jgi:hypothetical protein
MIHKIITTTKFDITGLSVRLEDEQFEDLIEELKVLLKATGEDNALSLFIRRVQKIDHVETLGVIDGKIESSKSERVIDALREVKEAIIEGHELRKQKNHDTVDLEIFEKWLEERGEKDGNSNG